MNFCNAYNKIMERLNEFNEPVSEINIFTGIVDLMEQLLLHIFLYGLCYPLCYTIDLIDKLTYPLAIIESKTHIYKRIIGPIFDWFEQTEQDITSLVTDIIYSITTSKCTKKK